MTFFVFLLMLLVASPAWAACAGASPTWTSTPDFASVQTCVTNALNGDTINVSAGSATWASTLTISKPIRLIGAGLAATHITNNQPANDLIRLLESTAGSIRVEGFDFIGLTGPGANFYTIRVFYGGATGKPVIINANNWADPMINDAIRIESVRGIVSNNVFASPSTLGGGACLNNNAALRHYLPSPASGSPTELSYQAWLTRSPYGMNDPNGDQKVYFETNTLNNVFEGVDTAFGASIVFRHNTVTNSGFVHHGADTGSVSARASEIYNNTFIYDTTPRCAGLPAGNNSFIALRGGTSLIHDNIIGDITSGAWGNKSEVNFFEENIQRNSSDWACWPTGANYHQTSNYPAPMQVGWGFSTGATFVGIDPTNGFVLNMDQEPVFLYANTGPGNYNSPGIGGAAPVDCNFSDSVANYLHPGTEWQFQAPPTGLPYGTGPGIAYQTFPYPHPLIQGGGPTAPGTPTNLQVI
jgi:hypothetical protein